VFWKRKRGEEKGKKKKKKRPVAISGSPVFSYLKNEYGLDDDALLKLRMVELEYLAGDKKVTNVRIFKLDTATKWG